MNLQPLPPRYVGFWARLLATLIDTAALGVVLVPLVLLFGGSTALLAPSASMSADPKLLFVNWGLPFLITALFWRLWQATPGKMAIGARIVDAKSGLAPSSMQLLVRYVGYFVSSFALCLGFLWIAFDARKQGWHDKMAGTVVISTRGETR